MRAKFCRKFGTLGDVYVHLLERRNGNGLLALERRKAGGKRRRRRKCARHHHGEVICVEKLDEYLYT
jgi:hypothetical protein